MSTTSTAAQIDRLLDALERRNDDPAILRQTIAMLRADLEEGKEVANRLQRSEERLRLALDAAEIGTWDWDPKTGRVTWDRRHALIFGADLEPAGGDFAAYWRFIHPEDREDVARHIEHARTTGDEFEREYRIVRPDGSVRWVASRGRFQYGEDHTPLRMTGTVLDISGRREGQRLRESEARYRAVVNSVREVIFSADLAGRWTFLNPAWAAITGRPVEECLGRSCVEFMHPDDRPRAGELLGQLLAGERDECRHEFRVLTEDGSIRWLDARARVARQDADGDGRPSGLTGTLVDVTGRREAERQHRESEQRLRLAMEAGHMGIWRWDVATNACHWSHNIADVLGVPQEFFDGTGATFDRLLHDDDRAAVWAAVRDAIETRSTFNREFRIRRPDGGVRWLANIGQASYDADGTPRAMTGTVADVTEQREAREALRRAKEAAEAANAAKDQFLATVTHELRSPLSTIRLWTSVLKRGGAAAADPSEALTAVERATASLALLVDDILDAARIVNGTFSVETRPLALAGLVERCVGGVRFQAHEKALLLELESDGAADVRVLADERRLEQVLVNLLTNAVKFTPAGGRVRAWMGVEGGQARVAVSDTGVGIDPDFLPRVFDRFAQERASGQRSGGLGLGLSIARSIVEAHGGTLAAHSDGPGRGATFTVTLPALPTLRDGSANGPPRPGN